MMNIWWTLIYFDEINEYWTYESYKHMTNDVWRNDEGMTKECRKYDNYKVHTFDTYKHMERQNLLRHTWYDSASYLICLKRMTNIWFCVIPYRVFFLYLPRAEVPYDVWFMTVIRGGVDLGRFCRFFQYFDIFGIRS